MNPENLLEFLKAAKVPVVKPQPKTFLGISRQPHYENVLSNIYAFFFDVNEEHGFGDLFISSLKELLQEAEENTDSPFYDCEELSPETEWSTRKGGRIDLLLKNDTHAIIVENKVYHFLNNDLKDYWESVEVADENKRGVVLSLRPVSLSKKSRFVNITHETLMRTVMAQCGNYIASANDKYLTFLKDFYQNIINISSSIMQSSDFAFYFSHQEEINNVTAFNQRVRAHVFSEIEKVASLLDPKYKLALSGKRSDRLRYYVSESNRQLMITVLADHRLFNHHKPKMFLVVEMQGKLLENKEIFKTVEFSSEERAANVLRDDFWTNKDKYWAHFAGVTLYPNKEEFANLGEYIIKELAGQRLLDIYEKLNNFLSEKKKEKVNG